MMNQGTEGIQRYTAATNDQTAAQRLADSQMGETERSIEEMNGAIETASMFWSSADLTGNQTGLVRVGALVRFGAVPI